MEIKTTTFDAVEESRKWREVTSRKLDAMTPGQRLIYLREIGETYSAERAERQAKRKGCAATAL